LQLRQVQRGGGAEGAAPGVVVAMALILRNARGRLSTGEVHQFGERF